MDRPRGPLAMSVHTGVVWAVKFYIGVRDHYIMLVKAFFDHVTRFMVSHPPNLGLNFI